MFIIGNFNFHVENAAKDLYTQRFLELLDEYGLHQLVNGATHEQGGILESGSVDLIITTETELVKNISTSNSNKYFGSDHFPLFVNFYPCLPSVHPEKK